MANKQRLIDANALLKKKYEIYEMGDPEELFSQDTIHKVVSVEDVKNAPTIEAAPVIHGYWKTNPIVVGGVCSVCGWAFEWWENDEAHYCPHCGAKMDLKGGGKDG